MMIKITGVGAIRDSVIVRMYRRHSSDYALLIGPTGF